MQNPIEKCLSCLKPLTFCFCQQTKNMSAKIKVLILQHPQEPKELLSTAPLITSVIKNCEIRTGLSWPNFKKAVGDETALPSQWGVMYLGSGIKVKEGEKKPQDQGLLFVDKKGFSKPLTEQKLLKNNIRGIIFLDGTWAQAKTLWWRNAWLLKLPRIVLNVKNSSMYGKLRKEPKRECLSTLESVAYSLEYFDDHGASQELLKTFRAFLDKIAASK